MLKTTELSKILAQKVFRANNNKIIKNVNSCKTDKKVQNLSKSKKLKKIKSRSLIYIPIIGAMNRFMFLTPDAKKTLNCLRQAFIKVSIF